MDEYEQEEAELHREGVKLLLDSGLLYEINCKILNPFGVALAINPERNGFIVHSNPEHPENFVFPQSIYNQARKKRDSWMKTTGNFILRLRKKRLGYLVQGPHDGEK